MIIPNKVANVPIKKPTKKKILVIELLWTPIDFKIAISLVLFLTSIVSPEIILNAAIKIIKDKITNITFLSTFNAEKRDWLRSAQVLINWLSKISWKIFFFSFMCVGFLRITSRYLLFLFRSKNSSKSCKFKKAIFWLNSLISLSKIDSTMNDFCL